MRKTILKDLIKIVVGFILCYLVSGVMNFLVGITLSKLTDSNSITMEHAREILESIIVIYLGFLVSLIIIGILIVFDFIRGNKSNMFWKLILIGLFYVSFEFGLI